MSNPKVISFQTEKGKRGNRVIETVYSIIKKQPCKHDKIVLYEDSRTCECKICGSIVDSFTVLLEDSRKQREIYHAIAQYEAAKSEHEKIIASWNFSTMEKRRVQRAIDKTKEDYE